MRAKRLISIGTTLCLGGVLTLATAIAVSRFERVQQQLQFSQQIDNLSTTLQRNIDRHSELLLSLSAFYDVSGTVSEAEFKTFVRPYLNVYPGIQALEWAPAIAADERADFEASVRALGYDSFRIVESDLNGNLVAATVREEYVPVTYIAPMQGNERAHGFDLRSNDTRRQALEEARDKRTVVASGRISLVQETEEQFGFLMFLPIFPSTARSGGGPLEQRNPEPHNPERSHSDTPNGYILGVFRVSDVVEESLANLNYDINFFIRDLNAVPASEFLGTYQASGRSMTLSQPPGISKRNTYLCPNPTSCVRELTVGQREWSIVFEAAESYPLPPLSWGAFSVMAIGTLLTAGLLSYLLRSQAVLDRMREINDLKLRFFSMASHELRTPLSTILICAQSLETNRDRLSTEQQDIFTHRIQTATKELSQLVDDILTLTRAESGKLDFAPRLFNLDVYCTELVSEIKVGAKSQSILFKNINDVGLVYLDPKLLRSILMNLLSNAVKYSPKHSIVELTLNKAEETLVIQVSDSGMGIPEATRQKLFGSFVRGENVGTIPGTGLGLSVVKTCVDLHGGTIAVDSELDIGTTVTVKLPLVD
ncbi:MAG: CHASE domain-containing protein [Synechococcus sp.]